jgi:hypothetical protein
LAGFRSASVDAAHAPAGAGSLDERRAEFRPAEPRDVAATAADRQAEEEAWRKERERYAQDERSG